RFSRDWSSDVCSSDLFRQQPSSGRLKLLSNGNVQRERAGPLLSRQQTAAQPPDVHGYVASPEKRQALYRRTLAIVVLAQLLGGRSEERRVGKERRARW